MRLNENTLELMKELTQIVGVSGREVEVSKALQNHYRKYTDTVIFDNLGSVFAVKKSKKENAPKVMVCGHMDEFGYIVKEITKEGLVKIMPLGGQVKQSLLAKRVKLATADKKEFLGTVVSSSKDVNSKVLDGDKLLVDLGASSKEQVLGLGVNLGDAVVVDGTLELLLNGERIVSKAWNNRYGCIMGVEVLEALKDEELDFDLYVGATVQEEVGLRGAITATNLIEPDMGIVMDCLVANDITGEDDGVGKLGEGILINYYDKSMMPNRALLNHLATTCKENDIKHQYYFSMADGDGGWIHKLLKGCPTLTANICGRNLNTNSSIIDANDYLAAKDAIVKVIKSLTPEKIEAFKCENR
ncbi:MAG: M42 family peptidase [Clostridium sp.]